MKRAVDATPAGGCPMLTAVRQGSLNVLGLVGLLQKPLTDDVDHEARAKAVEVLSKVAAEIPEALKAGDVSVIAEFLAGKLSDWRCAEAAVPGCCTLLQRYKQPSLAPLPVADAVKLVARLVSTVRVQGMDYAGRLDCYKLLLTLLQGPFAEATVLAGTDLVLFTLDSIEKEIDPRCLLVSLQCVEAVGRLYQRPQLSQVPHLQNNLEDLFDVGVLPYFPVIFLKSSEQKNRMYGINRDMVVQRVIAAMACCPEFAPLAIPLLSEKLGSDLKLAKEDALSALPVCLKSWGPAAVKPHLQAVWLMLKSELMAPAALDDSNQLEQLPAKRDMAMRAAAALQHSTAALGPGLLDQQVLCDVAVEDLLQYLGLVNPPWVQAAAAAGGGGSGGDADRQQQQESWHLPPRAQRRLACIATCVAAVVAAGGGCCDSACSVVLAPALAAVLQDTAQAATPAHLPLRPLQANCGVLAVLHQSLEAVAAALAAAAAEDQQVAGSSSSAAAYAALTALMPDIIDALSRLQQLTTLAQEKSAAAAGSSDDNASSLLALSQHEAALQRQQLQLWILLLWQDLLVLPPSISQLQQQDLTAAAQQLLHLALHGSSAETELELAAGYSTTEQAAAATALTRLACWPAPPTDDDGDAAADAAGPGHTAAHMQALSSCATQLLLPLLQGPCGDADDKALRGWAQALLAQLAGSSAPAAWQVLLWLMPLVLQQVQESRWDELCTTLPILNSSSLPALPADLPLQQSSVAGEFCGRLVQAWQQHTEGIIISSSSMAPQVEQQDYNSGVSSGGSAVHAAMLHSCLLVAQLTAQCSLIDQRQLLLPVCAWIMQAADGGGGDAAASTGGAAPPPCSSLDAGTLGSVGPVCIGLAVLAGGRPGLLNAASSMDLLQAAAALAVRDCDGWLNSTAAAVVVAGIINKSLQALKRQQQGQGAADSQLGESSAVQPDELLSAALPVLAGPVQQWLQHQQQPACMENGLHGGASAASAISALAWLARGLAMQRHDGWQNIMRQYLLPVLPSAPTVEQPADEGPSANAGSAGAGAGGAGDSTELAAAGCAHMAVVSQLDWAAAEFFSVLVAPAQHGRQVHSAGSSSSSGGVAGIAASSLGHDLSLHWVARPLWQQKAFVLALEALQAAAAAPATSAPPTGQHQQHQQQQECMCLAVASLVSSAPAMLSAIGQQQHVLLLQCIVHLSGIWQRMASGGGGGGGTAAAGLSTAAEAQKLLQLLHSCLLMLGDALSAGGGDSAGQLGPHAELMLVTLCKLAQLQQPAHVVAQQQQQLQRSLAQLAASVREVAVMCLTGCMSLPYHLLHPHRRQVLAAVMLALDDDKRAVRKAAVMCRSSWSSS